MSEGTAASVSTSVKSVQDFTLGDYGRVLWIGRRIILVATVVAGVTAAGASFLVPPSFEAVTTLIPMVPQERLPLLGQLGSSLEDLGISTSPKANSALMYPEIVRSRRLLEEVLGMSITTGSGHPMLLIDLVQPKGRGRRRVELAVRRMLRMVDAVVDRRSGLLTIRARARDAQVAAEVANALGSLLQTFVVTSLASQAGENRRFIEGRLQDTETSLKRAEEQLRAFRERNLRIGNSPHLLMEEGRLLRALREQEEVYLTLKRQYELAKVEEHRDVPLITVLDTGTAPTLRHSPRRGVIAGVGALFGGLVSFGILIGIRGTHGLGRLGARTR